MKRFSSLTFTLLASALLIASFAAFGAAADTAAAHTARQHVVLRFIAAHVDSACHVADTATAAATADSTCDWVRADARIRHSVRDFLKLRQQWLQLPATGSRVTRLELKFDSMLEHIRIYVVSVARTISGDWSYASFMRGERAYQSAVSDGAEVLLELDRLD